MIIIHHIRPAKTQISFGIRQIGQEPMLSTCKRLSLRVSNESKAMILIIYNNYCWSNAQADLSHRYMRIRKCSFCVAVVTS